MGNAASRVECRWCGRMATVKQHREQGHGRYSPYCAWVRWMQWLRDHDWNGAGSAAGVLREAGLVRMLPVCKPVVYMHGDGGWVEHRGMVPAACAPEWAITLAVALRQESNAVAAGRLAREHREFAMETCGNLNGKMPSRYVDPKTFPKKKDETRRAWLARLVREGKIRRVVVSRRAEIPFETRALILRSAAANITARELMLDDLPTALRVMADTWDVPK